MQIRPPYQTTNLAQVGIINEDIQLMKEQQQGEQKLGVEEAVATLGQIPDEIRFTHNFHFVNKCCEKQEESIFFIESIGELKLGGHYKCKCSDCKCQNCCKICCDCKCKCCNCCNCCSYEALHHYQGPQYILNNDKIRFEHYDTFAKLYIQNTLVQEFSFTPRNFSDLACGSCKSNCPHICFTNPLHLKNEKIYFKPLGNKCPINNGLLGICCICSLFGIYELERNIVANVGENGSAQIIARRTKNNACLSQCECQDNCCHFIDYPDFEMKFTNLSNYQKLGLIMSTISYTIFGRWEKYNYRGFLNMNSPYIDF